MLEGTPIYLNLVRAYEKAKQENASTEDIKAVVLALIALRNDMHAQLHSYLQSSIAPEDKQIGADKTIEFYSNYLSNISSTPGELSGLSKFFRSEQVMLAIQSIPNPVMYMGLSVEDSDDLQDYLISGSENVEALLKVKDGIANPPRTEIQHSTGINGAANLRGDSFIDAALLIANNIQDVAKKRILKKHINELKAQWDVENRNRPKDLQALERLLIEGIREVIYENKISFKAVKDQLDNAENHVNWKSRNAKERSDAQDGIVIRREERPISQFTPELTKEWLRILSRDNQPEWFKSLPEWERNYFHSKIEAYQKLQSQPNLGAYLGSVPTTIRRYPGAPNAYVTDVQFNNDSKKQSFLKIRSGVLVPAKMKGNTKEQKAEKVRITEQNMRQLIAVAIQEKIKEIKKKNPDANLIDLGDFPILLQTLYSPPIQPPPQGQYNNEAMQAAFKTIKAELERDPNKFIHDNISTNFFNANKIKVGKIQLLYANRPVNNARGLSSLYNLFSWQGSENRKTNSALAQSVAQLESRLGANDPDYLIAKAALESYQSIPSVRNTFFSKPPTDSNALAEKAALEQIFTGKVGIRIGSCVSGKDREEMVTEIAIAQQQFYMKYGRFPPHANPATKTEKDLRLEFERNVARQYLSGYGHTLAAENSKGCDGLKNIVDVFGKTIGAQIKALAPEYGIDVSKFDPIKDVQKIAGLNKLTIKKLNINTKAFSQRAEKVHQKYEKAFDEKWGEFTLNHFELYTKAIADYNSEKIDKKAFIAKQSRFLEQIPKGKIKAFLEEVCKTYPAQYQEFKEQRDIWKQKREIRLNNPPGPAIVTSFDQSGETHTPSTTNKEKPDRAPTIRNKGPHF